MTGREVGRSFGAHWSILGPSTLKLLHFLTSNKNVCKWFSPPPLKYWKRKICVTFCYLPEQNCYIYHFSTRFLFFTSFPAPDPTKVSGSKELALKIGTIKMYCNLQVDTFITYSFPNIDLDPKVILGLRFGFYSYLLLGFPNIDVWGAFPNIELDPQVFLGFRFGFYSYLC